MNFKDFRQHVAEDCLHETIYKDSEGREILVISTLDAYTMAWMMAMKAVREEREACVKVCEEFYSIEGIAQNCAAAIRARGNP